MVDLYVAEKNQASRLTQASLDVCAAGAGLLFLRAIGVRFEIGHLPVKTLLMSAGLAGLSGAAGREFCNSIKSGEKEKPWEGQNSNPFKLTTMVAFAVGALVLSQGERGRNLQYVGRVVSWMPPFASDNQMIATAAFSSISMCGFRYYFGSPTSSKKKTQLQLSPLPEK